MKILDTNMILRYLLNDNKTMAEQVESIINTSPVFVTPEVIAEVVYVMKGVYKQERSITADGVIEFINIDNIKSDYKNAIIKAL
jgi:pilT protein domain protein